MKNHSSPRGTICDYETLHHRGYIVNIAVVCTKVNYYRQFL